ncbi:MAG: T9SS type A sorting domain-containing protein [Ignavibacteria bacterium]|nr:T9SS type A sorting domain-containing protein [Ignavibacteria bacterium]
MKILSILILTLLFAFSAEAQWQLVNNTQQVFVLSTSPGSIFAGTNNGVYRASSDGTGWSLTSFNVTQNVAAIASGQSYILAGTSSGHGVYKSQNDGNTWSTTSLNNRSVRSLVVLQDAPYICFAGTISSGVYKSVNSGQNWVQTVLNNRDVISLLEANGDLFAGTGNSQGVYYSDNDGGTWSQTSLNNRNINALAVSGGYILAGTENGIYVSTNGGSGWTQRMTQYVLALAVKGDSVFAGTSNSGVYLSTNRGANWMAYNDGLGSAIGISAVCRSVDFVIAGGNGSGGSGTYRRQLGGAVGITPIHQEIPLDFVLSQNYPNPFNPVTNIKFAVPRSSFVKLVVYDISGQEIETLVNQNMSSGSYNADWNASNFSSGVYFYRIEAGEYSDVKKMILVK